MGRTGSFILTCLFAILTAGVAYGLSHSEWFAAQPEFVQFVVMGGAVGLAGLIVLLPCGYLLDRTLNRVDDYVTSAAESSSEPANLHVPKAFSDLTNGFQKAVRTMHQREADLNEALRNLQVRFRILQTESDQLKGVLQTMRDAVIVTDAFDEIVTLNESAAEVLDFDQDTDVRVPMEKLIADRRLCQLIREVREAGNLSDSRIVEHEIECGGDQTSFQISLSCLANHKGEVGAVVTILHDLTREREIAQMKSDFVSKASHELRTPLSSIRAYVEMLVDGEADDEESRKEFYSIIQNETGRLSRMIDNMLNISRIEAGIIQIDRDTVDVAEITKRAVDSLTPQAAEKNLSLSIKTSPVDLTAEGDEDMLYQVVLNLTSNAIKYTPDGGRITVSADSDNLTRSIVVTVADTGLGIPPDALPRLFEKFYRIENFKRVAKGTGLGLNLCKHIVETVHHGQIGVDSKLGMGSKFWFSIPMRFAGAQAA